MCDCDDQSRLHIIISVDNDAQIVCRYHLIDIIILKSVNFTFVVVELNLKEILLYFLKPKLVKFY